MAKTSNGICALLASMVISGCASAPVQHSASADAVSPENLDVLFATEFPVASKAEALAKSNVAYREGELDKAVFYGVQALRFDESDIELLLRIAQLHLLQGNGILAARAFNLALAQDPEHPVALQGLGLLYFQADKPEEARQKLELAVARNPQLWQAWNVLGILADRRGEHDLAAGHYTSALEINPDSVSVRINRGYSRYLAGDLHTAAVLLFELANETGHPRAWRNLGLVYAELGWYEDALDVFRKIDAEASAYYSAGSLALENDDLPVARAYLLEAVRQSPVYFAEAEQNLSMVRRRLGD